MDREVIEIQFTSEERSLILQYGYPFEGIEQALKKREASSEIEVVPIDRFELEQLIGQLCISINEGSSGALQDQLLELCDRLEAAEQYGDGRLDEL